MKICYIISTCDKYLDNRVQYQMDTFLSDVNRNDIFYLTSKPNIEKRQFGWNCLDDEKNITWKYIYFIYNMNTILDYDWYMFIDDDTFVFIERLNHLLKNYNKDELYYIGNELDHIKKDFCLYMSGGAGYAMSNGLYKLIYNYVKTTGINKSYQHWCDDLCIGLWINQLKSSHTINQIHNPNFLLFPHKTENELHNAITIHKIMTADANLFYYNISKHTVEQKHLNTTFVMVTDLKYLHKSKRTIYDLRSKGNWRGEIVLITIDFTLDDEFKKVFNVTEVKFKQIDKEFLLTKLLPNGFSNSDKRELNKLNQWEKFHAFDPYFMKWERVIYLDAGLRVLDDVKYLLDLDYKNKILAPKDGSSNNYNVFKCQLDFDNTEIVDKVIRDFGENILEEQYFLNCIWIYDTSILKICDKNQMIEAMNTYILCKTNEMGIMNLLLRFKYNLWEPFPLTNSDGKFLFEWSELNNPNTHWTDYCYIKYPVTISFKESP